MEEQQQEPSDQEVEQLVQAIAANAHSPDDKENTFTFLKAVATAGDTTKTGNLRDDKDINELGLPKHPVRTNKSLSHISKSIMGNEYFAQFFEKEAEIVTSTSLARHGFLTNLAVLMKREIKDATPKSQTVNKGWFKPKNNPQPQGV